MRYNSESLEITVVISASSLLSKDIKISLGLLNTVRKIHVLFRENHYLCKQSNSRIKSRTQNSKQILEILLNKKKINILS